MFILFFRDGGYMKRLWQNLAKCIGLALCVTLVCFNSGEQMSYVRSLPDSVSDDQLEYIRRNLKGPLSLSMGGGDTYVSENLSETLFEKNGSASICLFGAIPIKTIEYGERQDITVMPGGMPIGVSIYTDGALVVGLGSISETEQICPAASAGIRAGDVITAVDGESVQDSVHLSELCSKGGELTVTVRRDGKLLSVVLVPVKSTENDVYRAGMWVRDSTSGIGTLSFCNMFSRRYGALGHPITDIDTGSIIDVGSGSIVESSIIGVSAGSNGIPGEVIGSFSMASRRLGSIELNCEYGLYGEMDEIPVNPIYPNGVKLAYPDEVHTGKAEILSTVDDRGVCAYECEVIKLYPQKEIGGKGMVIRITDRELIAKTGGIVQGMSGSPVMQDGKLIGAVTHVFVNDAKCGYCIYSWWMNSVCDKIQ